MKYKGTLKWGEWFYIASKFIHRTEWNNRSSRFDEREDWCWDKWKETINVLPSWDSGLSNFILFNVSFYFGVDVKKLRPNDSLVRELRLPGDKLHWRITIEFFNEIEMTLDECMNVEDYKDLYAPDELYNGNIAEIIQFFQKLWSTFPRTGNPPWENSKWKRRWEKTCGTFNKLA